MHHGFVNINMELNLQCPVSRSIVTSHMYLLTPDRLISTRACRVTDIFDDWQGHHITLGRTVTAHSPPKLDYDSLSIQPSPTHHWKVLSGECMSLTPFRRALSCERHVIRQVTDSIDFSVSSCSIIERFSIIQGRWKKYCDSVQRLVLDLEDELVAVTE